MVPPLRRRLFHMLRRAALGYYPLSPHLNPSRTPAPAPAPGTLALLGARIRVVVLQRTASGAGPATIVVAELSCTAGADGAFSGTWPVPQTAAGCVHSLASRTHGIRADARLVQPRRMCVGGWYCGGMAGWTRWTLPTSLQFPT